MVIGWFWGCGWWQGQGASFLRCGDTKTGVNVRDLAVFFDEKTEKVERVRFLQRLGIWLEWDE